MVPLSSDRAIARGNILIADNAVLPDSLALGKDSRVAGWAYAEDHLNARQLDSELARAGWTFFYMAGAMRSNVFGFREQKIVTTALRRVIENVKLQKCNCLEIDTVVMHRFWGLPYVSIAVHARHIQKGIVFSGQ